MENEQTGDQQSQVGISTDLSDLPDVLLGNLSTVSVLSFYRRVLANSLISNGQEKTYGSQFEPILALLPQFIDQLDLMKFLVEIWNKKLKGMPRRDKVMNFQGLNLL